MHKDEAKDTSGEGLPPSPGQPGLLLPPVRRRGDGGAWEVSRGWSCPPDLSSVLLRLTADSSRWMSSLETRSNPIPGPLLSRHGKASLRHPGTMRPLCLLSAGDSPPLPAAPGGRIEADPGPALYGCPQTSPLQLTPEWALYG